MLNRLAVVLSLAALLLAPGVRAETKTFSFADPKGVNGVSFFVDSPLEPLVGIVGGVAGTVNYDPEDPASFDGEVSVDMAEVKMINSTMVDHLKGAQWLDIEDRFLATMTFDEVEEVVSRDGSSAVLRVASTLGFGQRQLPMTLEIQVDHFADQAKDRGATDSGDLLVLRSIFRLDRTELGLKPEIGPEKVGRVIEVRVPVVGYEQAADATQ